MASEEELEKAGSCLAVWKSEDLEDLSQMEITFLKAVNTPISSFNTQTARFDYIAQIQPVESTSRYSFRATGVA